MDPAANGSGFTAAPTATQNGKNSEETNSEFTEPRHLGAFHDDENDQTARLLHDRKRLMWCVVYFLSCSLLHEAVGHIHLSQLAVPGGRPRRSHLHLHHHRPSGQMPGGPALPGQLQAHEAEGDRRRQPVWLVRFVKNTPLCDEPQFFMHRRKKCLFDPFLSALEMMSCTDDDHKPLGVMRIQKKKKPKIKMPLFIVCNQQHYRALCQSVSAQTFFQPFHSHSFALEGWHFEWVSSVCDSVCVWLQVGSGNCQMDSQTCTRFSGKICCESRNSWRAVHANWINGTRQRWPPTKRCINLKQTHLARPATSSVRAHEAIVVHSSLFLNHYCTLPAKHQMTNGAGKFASSSVCKQAPALALKTLKGDVDVVLLPGGKPPNGISEGRGQHQSSCSSHMTR